MSRQYPSGDSGPRSWPITPAGRTSRRAGDGRWRLPVLMYHSIPRHAGPPTDPYAVPLPELEHQLGSLVADGWLLVGLTEALAVMDEDGSRRVVAVTFDDGLLDLLDACEVLERMGARATAYVPTGRVGGRGTAGRREDPYLRWAELAELSRRGVEIGSHAVRHRPLDVLPPAEVTRELVDSKQALADRLGVPVVSLCYPHGYASGPVRSAARDAGYTNACIVGRRIACSTDDVMALPRLQVRPGLPAHAFADLVQKGEPGLAPHVKRLATPAWRLTRLAARRLLHRELT